MTELLKAGVELHPPIGPFLTDLLTHRVGGRSVRVHSLTQWKERRQDIQTRVLAILGDLPKRRVPLQAVILKENRLTDHIRRKVSYAVEKGERVSAYLLMPKRVTSPRPAVLCLHQTVAAGKDEPAGVNGDSDLAYGLHLVRRGFVVLCPDSIAAGERVAPGLQPYDTAAFYARHPQWSAVGKAIWDHQRALDFLQALAFVDGKRIGCIGHSLGGHSATFLAAFDARVRAAVSNCGLTLFAEDPARLNWARDHWYVYMPRLRPYFLKNSPAPFDMHECVALIAPRAFLNISALNDPCFPRNNALAELAVRVNKVYRLHGEESAFATFLHGDGHCFPLHARELAYQWLERWLWEEPRRR